jgi:CRP-like cAMP-binding protein
MSDLEQVRFATTDAEREAIYRFRYSVYAAELGRKIGQPDHAEGRLHDDEDDQPYTVLLYTADDGGEVTGTLRLRCWGPGEVPEKDWQAFSMERVPGLEQLSTADLGRLMVRPGERGGLTLLALALAAYEDLATRGTDVAFANCATGLLRHYRLIGLRPYDGRLVPTPDGVEVPICVVLSDLAYLEQVGSFLVAEVPKHFGPGLREPLDISAWAHLFDAESLPAQTDPERVRERMAALASDSGPGLLESLSPSTIEKLKGAGFLLRVDEGDLLTEKGLGQREMFLVIDGLFEVFDGDRILALVGPGEPIGELAFFRSSGRRTASVRARTAGQVLVLRRRFIDELREEDPACAAEILFALARALADRVSG